MPWEVLHKEGNRPLVQYQGPLPCDGCAHFKPYIEEQDEEGIDLEHLYCEKLKIYLNKYGEELDVCLIREDDTTKIN